MTSLVAPPWPIYSMSRLSSLLHLPEDDLRRVAEKAGRFYDPFDQVRSGKSPRHIDNPVGVLKSIQRSIYNALLLPVPLPDLMVGGRRGHSIKDNAAPHMGRTLLVTIDLRDCFPRIDNRQVYDVFRDKLGATTEVAEILTKLTTFQRRLPQGAPTSLTLANLCLLPLYEEVQGIAEELGLACTFYVDDVALSGRRAREAIQPVIKAVQRNGHAVRRHKVRLMPPHKPQQITGLNVNRILGVGGKRLRRIRKTIHQLSMQDGISERQRRSIHGAIEQVGFINERQGLSLRRYADRCLPKKTVSETFKKRGSWKPCRCSRRHRYKRQQSCSNRSTADSRLKVSPDASGFPEPQLEFSADDMQGMTRAEGDAVTNDQAIAMLALALKAEDIARLAVAHCGRVNVRRALQGQKP